MQNFDINHFYFKANLYHTLNYYSRTFYFLKIVVLSSKKDVTSYLK